MSAIAARKAAALAARKATPETTPVPSVPHEVASVSSPNLKASDPSLGPHSRDRRPRQVSESVPVQLDTAFTASPASTRRKRKALLASSPTQKSNSNSRPITPAHDSIPTSPINLSLSDENDLHDGGLEINGGEMGGDSFMPDLTAPNGRPKKRRKIDTEEAAAAVSTFRPVKGVNYHALTKEEVETALDSCSSGLRMGGPRRAKAVIVLLSEGENLVLSGSALLTPLDSSLSIFSTTVSPISHFGSHPIYAPLTHPLPVLSPSGSREYNLASAEYPLLACLPLPVTFQSLAVDDDEEGGSRAMFLLQALDSGLEGMANGAVAGLGRIWPEGRAGFFGLEGCFPVLRHQGYPVYQHLTPPTWSHAFSSFIPRAASRPLSISSHQYDEEIDLARPLIALVKGPKRSGKSTLAREALNGLLGAYERVAYLDCDLGQSEFGCGGVVGLYVLDRPIFGPSFTHPATPIRSHMIGALNPRLLPEYYIASIANLLEYYRYEIQYPGSSSSTIRSSVKINEVVPLVINTQGWVKGLGADLLMQIEQMAQATHTFAFSEPETEYGGQSGVQGGLPYRMETFEVNAYNGFSTEEDNGPSSSGTTYRLEPISASPLLSKYSPADLRVLSTVSHMHATLPTEADKTVVASEWNFDLPLVGMRPWQIDLKEAIREVYLVGEGADGILEEDLGIALNGSMVGLLERLDPQPSADESPPRYLPGRLLPTPDQVNCLGIGLVRAISPDVSKIQLLTPLSPTSFSRISILIKTELELPTVGLMDWRESGTSANGGAGARKAEAEEGMLGLPWSEVPFLSKVEGELGVGMGKKRFRRNLMRKNQGV